jgi:hypothetical protein
MTREEFALRVAADPALQRRFVASPGPVLLEFEVDDELTEEELSNVNAGAATQSIFVHRLLTSILGAEES